jgi:hypothetical protein
MLQEFKDTSLVLLKESGLLFLACAIGIYTYHHLDRFYRLVFFQTVLAIISYISAHVIVRYQLAHNLPRNNHWMYNIYIALEVSILIGASVFYFQHRRHRKFVLAGFYIFFAIYLAEVLMDGLWQIVNISLVVAGVILVSVYQLILYDKVNTEKFSWRRSPELWLCLGISLYFACNVPFIGLLPQLYQYDPNLVDQLFVITEVLGNLRYLFLCISFWLVFRQHSLITSKT